MSDSRFGFTEMPVLSNHDHLFAAFLRKHKAIDNYHRTGNGNTWYAPDGQPVALAIYDNAACTYKVYVRSNLRVLGNKVLS